MLKIVLATIAFTLLSTNSFAALDCHGTEPFWGATLSKENLKVEDPVMGDSKDIKITKVAGAAGYTEEFLQVYSNEQGAVAVVRKTDSCNNGMSDHTFPQEVIILNGEVNLYGCCGEPLATQEGSSK